jgi:hypothetical protein
MEFFAVLSHSSIPSLRIFSCYWWFKVPAIFLVFNRVVSFFLEKLAYMRGFFLAFLGTNPLLVCIANVFPQSVLACFLYFFCVMSFALGHSSHWKVSSVQWPCRMWCFGHSEAFVQEVSSSSFCVQGLMMGLRDPITRETWLFPNVTYKKFQV